MKLSFIVSTFNRPNELRTCLSSLVCQTLQGWQAIVMDNSENDLCRLAIQELCKIDRRIAYWPSYLEPKARVSCYYSSEWAAENLAKGDWLCFPSDDSYYTPMFAEKMLMAGETGAGCNIVTKGIESVFPDLVCCDFVWGRRWEGKYSWTFCDGGPQKCHIDKTTFIIRNEWFAKIGWPQKDIKGGVSDSDGLLAEEMVAEGARIGRVTEILVVHN